MPWVFIRWLLSRFVRNVAAAWIALTLLLAVFDLLANASAVSLGGGHPLLSVLFYVLFRLPVIGNFILPFAALIAAVQTFAGLAARREILALESSGFTFAKVVLVLVAGAGLLAVFQFLAADQVVPEVMERLDEWKADGYAGLPKAETLPEAPEWLASGNYIVRMEDVSLDGGTLYQPTVMETDARGVAIRFWNADGATNDGDGWVFENVNENDLVLKTRLDHARMALPIVMPPALFSSFSKPVEELRFSQLQALGWTHAGTQIHPREFYRLQTHARLAWPLGGAVMVLLAAPVCLQVQRNRRRNFVSASVFAFGFLYFILQSLLLALGANGRMPAALAAWAALLIFGGIGLAFVAFRAR